jgi:FAD/FMN-containing dehydrogenase
MINQLEKEIREIFPDRLTWQKNIATFHAQSSEETSDIFCRAARHGQKLFISGFGNNIVPVGKAFANLLVIKTDRLNQVVKVNRQDFYVTVGAGYPLNEINHVLAAEKLWFPFGDTNYPGSFGGAIAAGLTGNDGDHPFPMSRFLLSVTAVLPDGSVVKPGALTFKSVSGYDISRLFFNSWGLLGVVIELSFRVLPISKKEEVLSRRSTGITLLPLDREGFVQRWQADSSLARLCRKIKTEYDPLNLLPLV